MKLYYGRSKDKKETVTFQGKTLYVSNPDVIAYLLEAHNKKPNRTQIRIDDIEVVEMEDSP